MLLLIEGRPRVLNGVADLATSVIWMGLQGPMGGQAAADIIFGASAAPMLCAAVLLRD